MTACPEEGERRPGPRERLLLGLARLALLWEGLWPRAVPVLSVAAVFIGVALLDVLAALPGWLHTLILIGFGIATLVALARAPAARPFGEAAVRHRLERDSGLAGRPLTALSDTLAGGADDPVARALWRAHLRRAAETARSLRLRFPSPGMAARDPGGFRAAALLVLVIGIVAGWHNPLDRLGRAVRPGGIEVATNTAVDVWITPPAYTGAPPRFLSVTTGPSQPTVLNAPEGSRATIQITGAGREPLLRHGDTRVPFAAIGGTGQRAGYRAETILSDNGEMRIEGPRGRIFARFDVRLQADLPPEVAFSAPPQPVAGARLRLSYQVRDDHGVSALKAVIERSGNERMPLALPAPTGQRDPDGWRRGASIQDLGAHRWAGTPVTVRLQAVDGLGQSSESDGVALVLPERTFNHPVARDLAAARKRLNDPGRPARVQAHGLLADVLAHPERFGGQASIYLGLAAAMRRLYEDGSAVAVHGVQDLLWDMALALEDGGLSLAAREVERLKRQLEEAMAEDPGSERTARLLDEVQAAMNRYLAALAEQLKSRGMDAALSPEDGSVLGSDQIRDLLERARELARAGDKEGARRLMAELGEMMEALRGGMENIPGKAAMERARRLLGAIRGLAERQSQVHKDTFRAVRDREAEDARSGRYQQRRDSFSDAARAQHGLTRELDRLARKAEEMLGRAPDSLNDAGREMKEAAEALSAGQGGEGLAAQAKALESLRQAMGAASAALARQMGGLSLGQSGSSAGMPGGRSADPFGRGPGTGGITGDGVKVPTKAERGRVRDILDELRRRAGEPDRSERERGYINRLLKRF